MAVYGHGARLPRLREVTPPAATGRFHLLNPGMNLAFSSGAVSDERLTCWRLSAAKFSAASQRSYATRNAGHSLSRTENHAESRVRPLTTLDWQNAPSNENP